jgi:tetratricopeptide (TPR) repeat protein
MFFSPDRPPLLARLQFALFRFGRRLADFGAWLISPLEWIVARVTHSIFAATERFDQVDSILIRIGLVLSWPLRMLWRLGVGIIGLLPESARAVITAPFRGIRFLWGWSIAVLLRFAEAINLDAVVWRIVHWTRPLWYPFAAMIGFFSAWLRTRDYRQLLWGLPVIAILLPLAAISGWTAIRGNEGIAAQYRVAVREAREDKDYERVRLFERKLAQLGVATELTDYQTALALAQDGKMQEAYERMQKLAPVEEPGFRAAHYWIVHQLLSRGIELPEAERQKLVRVHIDHLESSGVKGFEFDLVRAFALQAENKKEEAATVLAPHAGRYPQAAIMRMQIHMSQMRLDEARNDARLVRAHMEDRTRGDAKLSPQDFAAWTIAESLLGDASKAHSLAEQWYKLEPDNESAHNTLLELKLQLFNEMLRLPEPNVDQLAALFLEAAGLIKNPQVLQRQFATLYRIRSQSPIAERVVDAVVKSPDTPSSIMEAAGTVAATMGDYTKARQYLRLAVERNPENAVAWNNYAWIINHEPNGDLEEGLSAVNKALEIAPKEFRFRETRGQILVRLSRWKEAVDDLEYAANGMPDSADIHLSLAKAYEALGDHGLAGVHREHAARTLSRR